MKLKFLGERELISAIRKDFFRSREDLILGIGDDAAVVKAGEKRFILTKDMLVEDFHFNLSFHPAYFLGRKSLNVNLSDIAAMGGKPKYVLLGLGVSSSTQPSWLEEYFAGFKSVSEEEDVVLIGGDISQAKKMTISVTVIGEGKNTIQRKGGRPGHSLFVSGYLGDAKQGFLLLKKGFRLGKDKKADLLIKAFIDPLPQLALAQELARKRLASSMIDISDGLSVDLLNLCQESGCGAEIERERLPLSPELRFWQRKPYDFALHGGEDYQLLFSVPHEKMDGIAELQKKYEFTCIGKMTSEKGIYLRDRQGRRKPVKPKGYEHFK